MNQYASNVSTFCARNLAEVVLHPPTALTFTGSEWKQNFLRGNIATSSTSYTSPWDLNGNFFVRQFGLFCNFQGGLILATPSNRLDVKLYVTAYTIVAGTGTVTFTANNKAITGTNFISDLAPDIYGNAALIDQSGNPYFLDGSPSDDNNAILTDYARRNTAGGSMTISRLQTINQVRLASVLDYSLLNTMQDLEAFLPLSSLSSVPGQQKRILFSMVVQNSLPNIVNTAYFTNTISSSFAGQSAVFDGYAQIEYTHV